MQETRHTKTSPVDERHVDLVWQFLLRCWPVLELQSIGKQTFSKERDMSCGEFDLIVEVSELG